MTTISSNDIVWATAIYCGKPVVTFADSGYDSISDVFRAVRAALGPLTGIVELCIRNASRGWSRRRTMLIEPFRAGVQLTLF